MGEISDYIIDRMQFPDFRKLKADNFSSRRTKNMAKKKVESKEVKPAVEQDQERPSERAMRLSEPKPTDNLAGREHREIFSLDEYREEIAQIETAVREAEGEITDEQADQLVALRAGSIQKMKSFVWVIRHIGGLCEVLDAEIDRLSALKKFRKNIQDRLSEALCRHILVTQPDKRQIDLDTYIISAKKCPPSVEVDEGFNDPFYCDIKSIKNPSAETIDAAKASGDELVSQPNKPAIREALEKKLEVPGARLIDNKYKLSIK